MLVRNKKQVQKSFRIDEDVERDLGLLSQITGRSQNELVNVALEELLQDNSIRFLNIAILEHYESEVENADEITPFILGGLEIQFSPVDGTNEIEITSIVMDGEKELDKYTKRIDQCNCNELENYLMSLSVYIDVKAEDTVQYLKDRTDYRDYVKVRNKRKLRNVPTNKRRT
mgnify:CR=1 FL=1